MHNSSLFIQIYMINDPVLSQSHTHDRHGALCIFYFFLLLFLGIYGQHFCPQEYEYIKRKRLQLLVLPIVERGIARTLCLSVCLKMHYTLRIRFFFPSHLWTSHITPRFRIYLKLCLKVRTKYIQTRKPLLICFSTSCLPIPFHQESIFLSLCCRGLWDYQGTPVPWGKFPCSL